MPEDALLLLVKSQCHLCAAARSVVSEVAAEFGLAVAERSVDDDADLAGRYAEEVPVLFIDGVQRDFWTIDPDRLRRLLSARAG